MEYDHRAASEKSGCRRTIQTSSSSKPLEELLNAKTLKLSREWTGNGHQPPGGGAGAGASAGSRRGALCDQRAPNASCDQA
jgi:hypothetical protein